jgi:HNH endonuclease
MASVNPFLHLAHVRNAWVEVKNIKQADPQYKPGVTLRGLIEGTKNHGHYHELMKDARAGDVVIHIHEPKRGHKYLSGASIVDREAVRKGGDYSVSLRDVFWLPITDRISIAEFLKKHAKAIRKELTSHPKNYPFLLRKERHSQLKGLSLTQRYFTKLTSHLAELILGEISGLITVETEEEYRAVFDDAVADASSLDSDELRRRVSYMPAKPLRVLRTIYAFNRNPFVVAVVLRRAKLTGCEADFCMNRKPFIRSDGSPFLEVHHRLPLARGGLDTVENAIALCPNCHRKAHYGDDIPV